MFQRGMKNKHLQCALTLQNLFPIEISLVFKSYMLLLSAGFSHMCEKKILSQNIASKFASKVTSKVSETALKSWRSPFLNRLKSVFAQIEFLNNFIWEGVPLWKDMHWYTPPYRKLQQTAIHHNILKHYYNPLVMLLVCLGTTINFSYIWPVCFKVTCKLH